MASTDDIVLTDYDRAQTSGYQGSGQSSLFSRASRLEERQPEQVELPRPDGGRQAWLFLAGCFMIEALIWGFPFSFGIFQEYYASHPPFSDSPSGITVIGTSAMGIMYLGAPFVGAFLQWFPAQRRYIQFIGLGLMIVGLVASSFATKVWHLIVTQGIVFGTAGGLVYFPTILYLDEWFIHRKGFAFGVMWAGTGVSGVAIPFLMDWGLNKYGFATMLRAWAVVLLVMAGPLLYFVRPRIPVSRSTYPRQVSFAFLKNATFWSLQVGNILQSFGFFMPNIYLPTYARELGLSSTDGALTVALFNTTSVFGTVILGSLTDRFHVTSVILIATVGATISVFLLWGLAGSLPLLCIFSLCYGLFGGGYSSTYAGITQEIKKKDDRAELGVIFGLLAAGRGIGSVVSGPLSEALVKGHPWSQDAVLGYGSGYGPLIVFTGISMLLGGSGWASRRLGWV